MNDQLKPTPALAHLLESRLMEWERARKPQELKMLECYQDVMRIPRDDDTTNTGAAKSKKAKGLFIGSTRNKVRAARAKIIDALLGAGKYPFDTEPTNEKLAPYADAVETILEEQFDRMGLKNLLKTGVNTLATYGTGFMFGPLTRKECLTETTVDMTSGYPALQEQKYEYDGPYFDLANTLDVYPDIESREVEKGLGVFWTTMESPHTVGAWKADKSYSNIDQALQNPGENRNETGSEIADQRRANIVYWHKNDRIKVARFFGKVPSSVLKDTDADDAVEDSAEQAAEDQMVDVIVIMAGGAVVKVSESPYKQCPTLRCVYEAVEHEMWGVGVAENNGPHQRVTNAAFRLFMEGKGMALLGTKSVDRSKFLATEDFKKFPGKVYQFKPGLTPEEKQSAIIDHKEEDITGGWLDVIRMSEQFSDDDTGITKYTQGDDSTHLNKTATGISMIMSASSLPIKEVIQNIDEMWIEQIVERTIDWDIKYLEVETVQKIHGDEIAKVWEQIKQFGKTSFMEWKATGTSSFMQKEVLTNKIRAFAEFALSNPLTAQKVDVTELLQQTWDVMEIGRESPILDGDGSKIPDQVKQHIQQMQEQGQQLQGMLQQAAQETQKLQKQVDDKQAEIQVDRFKAENDRLKIVIPYLPPGALAEVCQSVGLQVIATDDIAPPSHPMQQPIPDGMGQMPPGGPPPQAQQPNEPPQGGFSLGQ